MALFEHFAVRVECMTYNHANFIVDTLKGFVSQNTDFPFVCTIIDDASNDGEPRILNKYLNDCFNLNDESVVRKEQTDDYSMVFAQHNNNKNCFFAVYFLKYNHFSIKKAKRPYLGVLNKIKYIAICEGDDYWIDPYKLQKQYETLESHPEIDMCACCAKVVYNSKVVDKMSPTEIEGVLPIEDVIRGGGGYLSTNTLVFRSTILTDKNRASSYRFLSLDYFLQIDGALRGGIYYLPEEMAVYRRLVKNSWTSNMGHDYKNAFYHKRRVLTTLVLFNHDTNNRYKNVIDDVIDAGLFSMNEKGFLGGCFDKYIKKMPMRSRIKYALSILKRLLFV